MSNLLAESHPSENPVAIEPKRAPTLYIIIIYKLLKGCLFLGVAFMLYYVSDNDLPREYRRLLHVLHVNPEGKFWVDLATQVSQLTEKNVLVAALGTAIYSMFSLVEGIGLIFRVTWAAWLAIGESAFFIPIEAYELVRKFSWIVVVILLSNIVIVAYIYRNRNKLFHHAHFPHRHPQPEPSIPDG